MHKEEGILTVLNILKTLVYKKRTNIQQYATRALDIEQQLSDYCKNIINILICFYLKGFQNDYSFPMRVNNIL